MEFDPVGSAESIPDMIKNDTLIEVLDQDQLCECLKHITLNVDQSLYILDKVQSKYKVSDRFKAIRHIFVDFGVDGKFDSTKFIEFTRSLGRCIHLDIVNSIADIIESTFSKNDQLSAEIKQISQNTATDPHNQANTQQISTSEIGIQAVNKNIEELKNIPKSEENFDKIYEICERIASEKDRDAMAFAIKKKYVYMTEDGNLTRNIFTIAAYKNNQDLIRFLIESGIDINSKDKDGNTALIKASWYGKSEVVKILLAVPGIDVNSGNNDNYTALIKASWEGHLEIVKLLLAVPGIDINAKDIHNFTALFWASYYGHDEIVKMLKDHGAI